GDLEQCCREIWAIVEPEKRTIARAFWEQYARSPELNRPLGADKIEELIDRVVPHVERKYGSLTDTAWTDMVRGYVETASRAGISLTTLYAGAAAGAQTIQTTLDRELNGELERLTRYSRAMIALTALEIDIFSTDYEEMRDRAERERRAAHGAEFNKEIVGVVDTTA